MTGDAIEITRGALWSVKGVIKDEDGNKIPLTGGRTLNVWLSRFELSNLPVATEILAGSDDDDDDDPQFRLSLDDSETALLPLGQLSELHIDVLQSDGDVERRAVKPVRGID
jgi:hypothetical protein